MSLDSSAPVFDKDGHPVSIKPSPPFEPMTHDDARAVLVREHKVAVDDNHPVLMMVSLHQGFCADLDKLLASQVDRLSAMVYEAGNVLGREVEQTVEKLKDKAMTASLDQTLALVEKQAIAMDHLHRRMRRHSLFMSVLTVLSVLSCGLVFAIVSQAIR